MTEKKRYHAVYAVGPVTMTFDDVEFAKSDGTVAAPVAWDPVKATYIIDTAKPGWEEYKTFLKTSSFRPGDLVEVAAEKKAELIERLGDRITAAKFMSIYTDAGKQIRGTDLSGFETRLVV